MELDGEGEAKREAPGQGRRWPGPGAGLNRPPFSARCP
jgi:hypothetical protein